MSGQELGHLGPILEKSCVRSRGHIFSPIFIKFGQNVRLYESQANAKMGHVKSQKNLMYDLEATF